MKKLENETYEDIPQAKKSLTYFLKNIFRKKSFRDGQLPILNRALQGNSVIGLLPTGGGKSLTYQIASLLQPGVTMVIDPIKSLMQDQYDNLVKNGIEVTLGIFAITPFAPPAVRAFTYPLITEAKTFGSVISLEP